MFNPKTKKHMRKLFFAMFALLLSASMVSCNQKQEAPAEPNADSAKVEAPAAEETPDLAVIVEKIKAEGANFTEDQWKETIGQALLAAKPVLVKMQEIMNKVNAGDANAAAEMEKFAESEEAKKLDVDIDAFEKVIESFPAAKKIYEDKAWVKEFKEKNGLPDLD